MGRHYITALFKNVPAGSMAIVLGTRLKNYLKKDDIRFVKIIIKVKMAVFNSSNTRTTSLPCPEIRRSSSVGSVCSSQGHRGRLGRRGPPWPGGGRADSDAVPSRRPDPWHPSPQTCSRLGSSWYPTIVWSRFIVQSQLEMQITVASDIR